MAKVNHEVINKVLNFCNYFGEETLEEIIDNFNKGRNVVKFLLYLIDCISLEMNIPKQKVFEKYYHHKYKKYTIGLIAHYMFSYTRLSFREINELIYKTVDIENKDKTTLQLLFIYKTQIDCLSENVPIEKTVIEKKHILDKKVEQYYKNDTL